MGRILTEDEWIEGFLPQDAPTQGNGFSFGGGCTLITGYQPGDREYLEALPAERIWTVVDDGDSTAITPGVHRVNNLGFIVTENPWTDDIDEVQLDD